MSNIGKLYIDSMFSLKAYLNYIQLNVTCRVEVFDSRLIKSNPFNNIVIPLQAWHLWHIKVTRQIWEGQKRGSLPLSCLQYCVVSLPGFYFHNSWINVKFGEQVFQTKSLIAGLTADTQLASDKLFLWT